ncbi:NADH pyrophosphatase [Porphyridium purpureum]|uniref:NAD(+) diphosphatase n=1 Tax=Porphyridium purpureum TaxID=35688 RepID=A0A5J4YVI0_PORPP|nr:NADH pyrophosphatase [Porphyridium purpureum]|eukprot:POR7621..scf227_4
MIASVDGEDAAQRAVRSDVLRYCQTQGVIFDKLQTRVRNGDEFIFYAEMQLKPAPLEMTAEEEPDLMNGDARLLLLVQGRFLFAQHRRVESCHAITIPASMAAVIRPWMSRENEYVLLGAHGESGACYFAAELEPRARSVLSDLASNQFGPEYAVSWTAVRDGSPHLDASDAAVLAKANGLLAFHANQAVRSNISWRAAPGGAASQQVVHDPDTRPKKEYPRTDPAVLCLVEAPARLGDFVLLGSGAKWPFGRYSCLAGFCELGESLEKTVQREVWEESGVLLEPRSIQYVKSQPWPFPRSLMVGFRGRARRLTDEGLGLGSAWDDAIQAGIPQAACVQFSEPLPTIHTDRQELQDARWIPGAFLAYALVQAEQIPDPRGWMRALTLPTSAAQQAFGIPGKHAMAGQILREYASSVARHYAVPPISVAGRFDARQNYILVHADTTSKSSEGANDPFGCDYLVRSSSTKSHDELVRDVGTELSRAGLPSHTVFGGGVLEFERSSTMRKSDSSRTESEASQEASHFPSCRLMPPPAACSIAPAPQQVVKHAIHQLLPFTDVTCIT